MAPTPRLVPAPARFRRESFFRRRTSSSRSASSARQPVAEGKWASAWSENQTSTNLPPKAKHNLAADSCTQAQTKFVRSRNDYESEFKRKGAKARRREGAKSHPK